MKLIWIFYLLLGASLPLHAEEGFERGRSLVQQSFDARNLKSIQELLAANSRVLEWEHGLEVSRLSSEEHLRIKYLISHWRHYSANLLVLQAMQQPFYLRDILQGLKDLRAPLSDSSLELLNRVTSNSSTTGRTRVAFLELAAAFGNRRSLQKLLENKRGLSRLAGPVPLSNLAPMVAGPWKNQGWLNDGEFRKLDFELRHYLGDASHVVLRGTQIRPGDILLIDHHQSYDGLNTSFSSPRSSFTHCGVVVFLEYDSPRGEIQTYPAVLEIHEAGVRVVPLANYISASFSDYLEVYRLRDESRKGEAFSRRLNVLARTLLDVQLGYDFNARPIPQGGLYPMLNDGHFGVTCSSLADLIYKSLGIDLKLSPSQLPLGARMNIALMGLSELAERGNYIAPSDFKQSPALERVGVIDNAFGSNVQREVLIGSPELLGSVGQLLTQHILDAKRLRNLSWRYRLVEFLAKRVEKKSWLGRTFLAFTEKKKGLNVDTFPMAPSGTLAAVSALNQLIEEASNSFKCSSLLEAAADAQPFDLLEIENSLQVRSSVIESLQKSGFSRAFR